MNISLSTLEMRNLLLACDKEVFVDAMDNTVIYKIADPLHSTSARFRFEPKDCIDAGLIEMESIYSEGIFVGYVWSIRGFYMASESCLVASRRDGERCYEGVRCYWSNEHVSVFAPQSGDAVLIACRDSIVSI